MNVMKQITDLNHTNGLQNIAVHSPSPTEALKSESSSLSLNIEDKVISQKKEKVHIENGKMLHETTKSEIQSKDSQSSSSRVEEAANLDCTSNSPKSVNLKKDEQMSSTDLNGGTLTFFQEGKPLLELFHKNEKSAWFQVKSKTYWPPSTTAKTTSICHEQFRHDHSMPLQSSDDFSSSTSSPWSHDHIRKQNLPRKLTSVREKDFIYTSTKSTRNLLKGLVLKRNPRYQYTLQKIFSEQSNLNRKCHPKNLKEILKFLCTRLGIVLDYNLTIHSILEKGYRENNSVDHSFLSPRKRYLRSLDSECDAVQVKKKSHGMLANFPLKENPSIYVPVSAMNNSHTSSYSIDSLLSNDTGVSDESFLRTILKNEKCSRKASPLKPSKNISGKNERHSLPYHKDLHSERHKIDQEYGNYFSPTAAFSGLYMNPYLNPHGWNRPPMPTSSHADAVAAAVGHMNFSSLTTPPLMSNVHSLSPMAAYLSQAPIGQLLSVNQSSASVSPSSSSIAPVLSPHASSSGSPRPSWPSPSCPNRNSPYKSTSPLISPPPQDVPLNLSKPKEKG